MPNFFTDLYKDELIYSGIARQAYYSGKYALKDVQRELFHKDSLIPTLNLGTHIDKLLQQISSSYKCEDVILEHTNYPFYKLFLPKERQHKIEHSIKNEGGSRIYLLLGSIAGGICKKDSIYYCSQCVKEDIEREGECYIHREHQLEGIMVCPHHGTLLSKYCKNRRNTSRVEYIRLDDRLMNVCDKVDVNLQDNQRILLFKLSKMAYELMNIGKVEIDRATVLRKYRTRLWDRGLITPNGQVRQKELYDRFVTFYGQDTLVFFDSALDNDKEFNWLRVVTRDSKRTVHPIRHLLLMNFLGLQVRDLLGECDDIDEPFGKGPWPCLNKVSLHYLEDVIPSVVITTDYKESVPVGTFYCSCGFVYSRRGPDKKESDRYKIGRKKQFGEQWEERLHQKLLQGTYHLRQLAREMDCDPKTIQKYDQKFETYRYATEGSKSKTKYCTLEKANNVLILPQQHRREVKVLARANTELNKVLQKSKKVNMGRPKVDWESRDKSIMQQLQETYKELLIQRPMVRITLSSLAKRIGMEGKLYKWISMKKLLLTKQYVEKISESVQDYQIRRCRAVIHEMRENGEIIKLWKVQRKAGIRTKQFKKLLLKLAIDLIE